MANAPKASAGSFKVNVVFSGQQKGEDLPPSRAYLFDRSGKLLDSEVVVNGAAAFRVEPKAGQKVMVGPDLYVAGKPPADLEAQLVKSNAVTQDIVPQVVKSGLRVPISNYVWGCWWKTCIVVHGTVRKLLNPGDPNPQYATICNGTVQIFQVDLGCTLDNLASFEVLTFRDRIVDVLLGKITMAQLATLPPILVNPNPPDPAPESALRNVNLGGVVNASTVRKFRASAAARASAVLESASLNAAAQVSQVSAMASSITEVATVMSTLSGKSLNDFIVANKAILFPFWCLFIPDDWFCWQELGEVSIQSDGSFSAEICFWCPDDFPDLYFEVIQNIGGVEREISDPQIACSTYYDYDGSQSVDIVVDDPTAVACLPDPGRPIPGNALYVWPTAIGNVDLRNITDLESGLTSSLTGLVNSATPWGGTLALQVIFDPTLKASSTVRYYRWSYMFDGDSGFTQITTPVNHRYMTVSYSPLRIDLHTVNLGPHPVGSTPNLYDVPDPFPGDGWVDINDPYDRPFGYFDSTGNGLAPFTYNDVLSRRSGLCTLMLEMFDVSGNPAPCSNLGGPGQFVFVLPDMGIPTQYTSVLTANNITPSGALVFRVRVDNNDTVANLIDVDTTVPCTTDCDCGMRHYNNGSDLVSVHYAATHPNNFLTWGLSITRGTAGTVATASGATSSPPMSLPFPSTPGVFKNTASSLLGHCANAAFAVNLDTYADATDGYGRQSQYDRSAAMAFALITP